MLTELVDVNSYDWNKLPPCGFFEVLGKRGTGKTSWTQYILQSSPIRNTGNFIVMAGSETAKNSWSKIVHPLFVVDPDLKYLENLRDTQNELVRKYQKLGEPFPLSNQVTLILDDVSSNKKLMRSQILSYLASNSRHLQMSIYILAQYHCQIVTEVRNQFDLVFMLSTSDTKSIVRLHGEFCSGVDFRIFKHVLSHVTQDYGMLVINNQATSVQMTSICFHASMKNYPPQLERLGPDSVWDFGEEYYCDENATRPDAVTADAWQQNQDDHQTHHVVHDRKGKVIIRTN
jgi:hypothetical protein